MGGLELLPGRQPGAFGRAVCERALDHGLLIRPLGDLLVIMPPLTISPEETQHLAAALAAAISGTGTV
jgi:adenosylmethionine-8-amino-7-oxononanoate aminotransferase